MKYFDNNFIEFFKNLAKNNNKEWFNENRKKYENSVRKPFHQLIKDVIVEVKKYEPKLELEVKNTVFRINRDIRFSKDKTPYKMHVAAVVSKGGRKNLQVAGIYLHFGAGEIMIGGGCHAPDKENLYKIREAIVNNPKKVEKILKNPEFVKIFGELKGEKNKIIPKEFKTATEQYPILFNKQFYFMAKYNDNNLLLKDNLVEFIMQHYKASKEWNDFMNKTMEL